MMSQSTNDGVYLEPPVFVASKPKYPTKEQRARLRQKLLRARDRLAALNPAELACRKVERDIIDSNGSRNSEASLKFLSFYAILWPLQKIHDSIEGFVSKRATSSSVDIETIDKATDLLDCMEKILDEVNCLKFTLMGKPTKDLDEVIAALQLSITKALSEGASFCKLNVD